MRFRIPVFAHWQPALFRWQDDQLGQAIFDFTVDRHRPCPNSIIGKAEFGLSEKLEEIRHRTGQPDFDHPASHRANFIDLGQIETKRCPAKLAQDPQE